MAQNAKGLGRGLDILLGGFSDDQETREVFSLPLDALRPNPEQPRRTFSEASLAELAASIREQGVIQPVLARPIRGVGPAEYEIVAGERRWRAAKLAGLTAVPVLVREVDDEQSLALALIENLQREDLNPMEQAAGLHMLISRFGLSQETLARKVGMSRPAVANTLRLLGLPEPMRADLAAGTMTAGHARALLSLADAALRQALWLRIREAGLSVREAEDVAAYAKAHGQLPAPAEGRSRPEQAPRRRAPKPAMDQGLRRIEGLLTERAGVMVKTSGTADHGKITFHFSSNRELQGLLEHFGLAVPLGDADRESGES